MLILQVDLEMDRVVIRGLLTICFKSNLLFPAVDTG